MKTIFKYMIEDANIAFEKIEKDLEDFIKNGNLENILCK